MHQFKMDILVVGLNAEVILENLSTCCAHPRIVFVNGNVHAIVEIAVHVRIVRPDVPV